MTGTHYDAAGAALAKGRTSEFPHKLQLLAANKHRDFDCVRIGFQCRREVRSDLCLICRISIVM
jgi:hypothetical protein